MPWPPNHTTTRLRAGVCGLLTATALGGAAVAVSPSPAVAAPDPCAASQIAKTVGVVATNTGTYLDTHPQTNQALTTISQQRPARRPWWRSRVTSTPTPRRARTSRRSSSR